MNWNTDPLFTDTFDGVLDKLKQRDLEIAKMDFCQDAQTTLPEGAIRFNQTSKVFEIWNAQATPAWQPLPLAPGVIGGLTATAAELNVLQGATATPATITAACASDTARNSHTHANLTVTAGKGLQGGGTLNGGVSLSVANSVMPVGAIIIWPTSIPPAGFLECNGCAVSRTTYADLYSVLAATYGAGDGSTTFNLPELRGEFVRGWDHGRGIDSGRGFASFQSDTFKNHYHTYLSRLTKNYAGDFSGGNIEYTPSTGNTSSTGDAETRPRNVALMYCIKY